jgi:hypothetical protein
MPRNWPAGVLVRAGAGPCPLFAATAETEAQGLFSSTIHFDGGHVLAHLVAEHGAISAATGAAIFFVHPKTTRSSLFLMIRVHPWPSVANPSLCRNLPGSDRFYRNFSHLQIQ